MNRKNRKGTIPFESQKVFRERSHKEMKENQIGPKLEITQFLEQVSVSFGSLYKGFTIYIKIIWPS